MTKHTLVNTHPFYILSVYDFDTCTLETINLRWVVHTKQSYMRVSVFRVLGDYNRRGLHYVGV